MSRRGRPKEPLNRMQVNAILAVQDGKPAKVAAIDAGYPVNTDFKNVIKRARERIGDALLCESVRLEMREKYPDLALVGTTGMRKGRLVYTTPEQRAFHDITEPHLVFYERLISQGWHFNEEGSLVGPEKK
jgi:hypothetical protein